VAQEAQRRGKATASGKDHEKEQVDRSRGDGLAYAYPYGGSQHPERVRSCHGVVLGGTCTLSWCLQGQLEIDLYGR
jgi:hypothetical protein